MFITGTKIGVLSSTSTTGSSPIINLGKPVSLNSSSVFKGGSLLSSDSASTKGSGGISTNELQSNGSLQTRIIVPESTGNNTLENYSVNKTSSETTNSSDGTVTLESLERKASPQFTEAITRTASVGTSTRSNVSSGNVSHLVKLVNSVSKVETPQAISPLVPTSTVNSKSPPSVTLKKVSAHSPPKPATHLPRQIAMKQPVTTAGTRPTSIVLNLKPGEAIPKAINLLGPDGKSMVLLTLSDGGKQLVSPTGSPHTGGKILIPIPTNIISPPPSPKQITLVNKVYPIAPNPAKTTIISPQGGASPLILSVSGSGSSQKPLIASTVVGSTVSSVSSNAVSNSSESRPSVVSLSSSVSGTKLGTGFSSPSITTSAPAKIATLDPKPSSSTVDKSTGLSPHEAKIQRLKELIKRQEDAVNKLREKRRLEMERIRDPSLSSKLDDGSETSGSLKTERLPLAEQKRPSSPFAVPLPPKKRIKEFDPSFKTSATKATDSSATPSEGAFIPNADDKAFVQLVGLENVVNNIK